MDVSSRIRGSAPGQPKIRDLVEKNGRAAVVEITNRAPCDVSGALWLRPFPDGQAPAVRRKGCVNGCCYLRWTPPAASLVARPGGSRFVGGCLDGGAARK
jgi:hypothetical protein